MASNRYVSCSVHGNVCVGGTFSNFVKTKAIILFKANGKPE